MREPRLRSSPSFFHPSTNRRMYRFASNGEMGEPCGMPRRLSRASVVRVFLPRSSVSSTGHSSHILIRCSTRRSTIRRVTDFTSLDFHGTNSPNFLVDRGLILTHFRPRFCYPKWCSDSSTARSLLATHDVDLPILWGRSLQIAPRKPPISAPLN